MDEGLTSRRKLYPKAHNNHKRNTSMSPTGFEPKIPETAWALESAKYVINNNRSQKNGADASARTSHKHEKMKSAVYPLLLLQRWLNA